MSRVHDSTLGQADAQVTRTRSTLYRLMALSSAVKVAFFVLTLFLPISNESRHPVSPTQVSGTDLGFYMATAELMERDGLAGFVQKYVNYYQNLSAYWADSQGLADFSKRQRTNVVNYILHANVGPLFPKLLGLFGYGEGNTLPLALFYLAIGIVAGCLWLCWLWWLGPGVVWLVLFCFLPAPLYFMVSIGTDLPFFLAMALFFVAYVQHGREPAWLAVWCLALVIMVALRPNSLSLLAFVFLDLLFWHPQRRPLALWFAAAAFVVLLGVLALLLHLPHGLTVLDDSSRMAFFGHNVASYAEGLFDGLPALLDRALSLLALLAAKLLYFVGLRPSFGDTATALVLVRAAPGLILLPGLLYAVIACGPRIRLLVVLYLLPVLLGPAQDRYNLAIQPLLYAAGAGFYTVAGLALLARLGVAEDRLAGMLTRFPHWRWG